MAEPTLRPDAAGVAESQATIARQAVEIDHLRQRLAGTRPAEDLLAALATAAAAGTIGSPVSHARVLEMIVETAAEVIGARSAALFHLDAASGELVFEVALGPKAEEVKQHRVPLGHGIAGLVAISGQPMAIANAEEDDRQAADIAESVGYTPESIVCVPLIYADRVTGVLELLDKIDASSFSANDIHTLGLFANQAAVAIEQSQAHRSLGALLTSLVQPGTPGGDPASQEPIRRLADQAEAADPHFRATLELADLVREIAWQGDRERDTCLTLLRGFGDYLRHRPHLGTPGGPGSW